MSTEGSSCPWIASDRVEGTAVYGPDKERIGIDQTPHDR